MKIRDLIILYAVLLLDTWASLPWYCSHSALLEVCWEWVRLPLIASNFILICAVSSVLMDCSLPSVVCAMCRPSPNVVRTFLFSLLELFASHQLERAGQVILKVEYDLRAKGLKYACQRKKAESYSRDRKVDVQKRALVRLPAIEKKMVHRRWKFDNHSSLVFLAAGVKRFTTFNSSNWERYAPHVKQSEWYYHSNECHSLFQSSSIRKKLKEEGMLFQCSKSLTVPFWHQDTGTTLIWSGPSFIVSPMLVNPMR